MKDELIRAEINIETVGEGLRRALRLAGAVEGLALMPIIKQVADARNALAALRDAVK